MQGHKGCNRYKGCEGARAQGVGGHKNARGVRA